MGFSKDFVWGAATSSYQIEGGVRDTGKGMHVWDVYTKEPGRIYGGHTGDTACDHYHRFREDVQIMKEIGLKAYRFSIDWSRILPGGGSMKKACGSMMRSLTPCWKAGSSLISHCITGNCRMNCTKRAAG